MSLNQLNSYGNVTSCSHPIGFSISSNKYTSVVPKGEFYYVGERVLRPMIDGMKDWIDVARQIASYVIDLLKTLFYSIDNALSRLCNFIPGVRATNDIYNNQGPFRQFNPVATQKLLPGQTPYWFDVTRFEQSTIHSGILRIVRKIGNLFVNEAYPIKHGPKGIELDNPRIISQNSNQAQSFSMGVELTENSSAEVFTNATSRVIYVNSLNSENKVTKTCQFNSDSSGRLKNIWSANEHTVITELTDAPNFPSYYTNLANCLTIRLGSRPDAIYHSPEQDKIDLFALSTIRGAQAISIKGFQSSTGNPIGPVHEIRPSFNFTMRNIRVIENPETDKNVVLIASTNPPGFCSQLLDKINNYKPMTSSSPYCQGVSGISLVNGLNFEKISQKDDWRGYVALFDITSSNADKSRNGILLPISKEFRLAPQNISPFSFNINTGSLIPSSRGSSFVFPNPKVSGEMTSIWVNPEVQASTIILNPLYVKGNQTSDGATFPAKTGFLVNLSVFGHNLKPEDIRYNFTYLGTDRKPIKDGIDCADLNDPDVTCSFDWRQGVIRVLSRLEDTLLFNASASYKNLFRASSKIKVEITNSHNGSPTTIIYIGLFGIILCLAPACVCASILIKRICWQKFNSFLKKNKYGDDFSINKDDDNFELLRLTKDTDITDGVTINWKYHMKDFTEFESKEKIDPVQQVERLLKLGKDLLDLNEIDRAKGCLLQALALNPENDEIYRELEKAVQEQLKNKPSRESFLIPYKIEKESNIRSTENLGNDEVYKGKYSPDVGGSCEVAIKEIKISKTRSEIEGGLKEAGAMAKLFDHLNIVSLVGFFEGKKNFIILTELLEKGSLAQIMKTSNSQYFLWDQKYQFIWDLVNGLDYIHQHGLYHGNLTPNHIFSTKKSRLKIGGFSECQEINSSQSIKPIRDSRYADLEVLFGSNKKYDTACDIFSLGLVIYFILSGGKKPRDAAKTENDYKKLHQEDKYYEEINCEWPSAYQKILQGCWAKKREDRLTTKAIRNLLKKNKEELIKDQVNEE
jgi:hypothetical protein